MGVMLVARNIMRNMNGSTFGQNMLKQSMKIPSDKSGPPGHDGENGIFAGIFAASEEEGSSGRYHEVYSFYDIYIYVVSNYVHGIF